jgi:hypothetical protein
MQQQPLVTWFGTNQSTVQLTPEQQRRKEMNAARAEKRLEISRRAAETVSTFDSPPQIKLRIGQCKLPQELVNNIMKKIVDYYEPDGIRGVGITLRDLNNAALSCPDFFEALRDAYEYFSTKLPILPCDIDWALVLAKPMSVKIPVFKMALGTFNLPTSGTKCGMDGTFE